MSVRFLLGPAGSGKTHHCLQKLRQLELGQCPAIYLVPEQFTYSADRELMATNELAGLRHVHVLSFTRFAWWLHEKTSTPVPNTIDDAVRPMYLRAVIEKMGPDELGAIMPLKREHGLLQQLSRFVGEVRNHAATDFLQNLAEGRASKEVPPGVLEKLRSLAAVYEAYSRRLRAGGWRDPEERLAGMTKMIAEEEAWLSKMSFFVDGFLSWTRREVELLIALARTGAQVEIALCCDPTERDGGDPRVPFGPVWRSYDRLVADFERASVKIEPPLHVRHETEGRFETEGLKRLESRIYAADALTAVGVDADADAAERKTITLQPADDRRQEVISWARQIDRWTRLEQDPVRSGEVAVLLRDLGPYRDLVSRIFPRYGISYFLDERRSALAHPRCRLILHALEILLGGWRRSTVVGYLRNPLLGVDPATVDLIENLSLQYGRDFEAWYATEWENFIPGARSRYVRPDSSDPDPNLQADPFAEEDEDDEQVAESESEVTPERKLDETCQLTDQIRHRVLSPLRELQLEWERSEWTGKEVVERLSQYAIGVLPPSRKLENDDPEWEERVSDALANLLAEMADIWADVAVTVEEFTRTLREGLRALKIGVTPLRHDQVVVGDVQRSRLHGIKRAIVGGVNEGVFPRAIHDDPILNERDREALSHLGLPLGPTAVERQEEEAYLFYIALTRASDELCVTWSGSDESGTALSVSLLLGELRGQLPGLEEELPFQADEFDRDSSLVQVRSELTSALLRRLSKLVRRGGDVGNRAGSGDGDGHTASSRKADQASSFDLYEVVRTRKSDAVLGLQSDLERELPGLLFGNNIHLPEDLRERCFPGPEFRSSVSRLSEFVSCPYQNFARSVLRLEPRAEAKITPLETGSLAHDVLERFFQDLDPRTFDLTEMDARLADAFEQLETDPAYRAFQIDASSTYRWSSTRLALKRFLGIELGRLARSTYSVRERELPFGLEDRPPLILPLAGGMELILRGKIDRVDIAPPREAGERERAMVVDYKRTRRSGLPRTLEEGLDLQLGAYLLYLERVQGYEPVGGIYLPVLPSPPRTEKMRAREENPIDLKAHGLVLESERDEYDAGSEILVKKRKGGQILPDAASLGRALKTSERYLTTYAENLCSGWIEPRPLQTDAAKVPCDHCDYQSVCRFQPATGGRRHQATEGMKVTPVLGPDSNDGATP